MVADAWISPTVVELKLPVAIATIRNKKAAGFQIVTRERTTDSKYVVPPPSSYVRYRESLAYGPRSCTPRLPEGGSDLLGKQGTCK